MDGGTLAEWFTNSVQNRHRGQCVTGVHVQTAQRCIPPTSEPIPQQSKPALTSQFTATLSHGATEVEEEIYAVQGLETALVGHPAIETMDLISRMNTVKGGEEYVKKYPDLFQGLGSMEGLHFDCFLKSSKSWREWRKWE